MPYTTPFSFDRFLENISLTGDHEDTAEARRKHLVDLLTNTFTILDSFATGSIPKGTALKAHADLDVMVVLHFGKHIKDKLPSRVLQDVRDALGEYKTGVRKNGQAVTLSYTSWPSVDIVPVSRVVDDAGKVKHYSVPDMNNETWIESRPRRHASAIAARAQACGDEFLSLIRMIKQWNRAHSELMSSYHIEVLALSIYSAPLDTDSWEVFRFFDAAATSAASPIWYEGSFADEYLDAETREQVVKRLETARDWSRAAWHATYAARSDHEEAIRLWRLVFGDKFPAYG